MKRFYYWTRGFCSVIIGLVFFVSGILKISDPVGTTLIVSEYLNFFRLDFISSFSVGIAIFFASVETVTGVALVTSVYKKLFAFVSFLLTGFFFIVTLILLIFNPTMDCGCFGELVHLTHLQSFIKNVILALLACVAFLPFRDFGRKRLRKVVSFWVIVSIAALILLHSLVFRPLVDLTPFKKAATLDVVMSQIDEAVSETEVRLIYEKDGAEAVFTLDALPDSTWNFVRSESSLVIDDDRKAKLEFRSHDGEYLDNLAAVGRVMVISVYDIKSMNEVKWERVAGFAEAVWSLGITPLLLVSATSSQVQSLVPDELQGLLYYADYRTLISLNRSNGGAVLFDDGILVRKWANRSLEVAQTEPDKKYFGEIILQSSLLLIFILML